MLRFSPVFSLIKDVPASLPGPLSIFLRGVPGFAQRESDVVPDSRPIQAHNSVTGNHDDVLAIAINMDVDETLSDRLLGLNSRFPTAAMVLPATVTDKAHFQNLIHARFRQIPELRCIERIPDSRYVLYLKRTLSRYGPQTDSYMYAAFLFPFESTPVSFLEHVLPDTVVHTNPDSLFYYSSTTIIPLAQPPIEDPFWFKNDIVSFLYSDSPESAYE